MLRTTISQIAEAYHAAAPRAVSPAELAGEPTVGRGGRLHAPHDGYEHEGITYRGGEFLPEETSGCSEGTLWADESVAPALAATLGGCVGWTGNGRSRVHFPATDGQQKAIAAVMHPEYAEMPVSEIEAAGLPHGKAYRREIWDGKKWRRVLVARVYRQVVA